MRRVKKVREVGGWSGWIQPRMDNYILVCCDCGLAHRLKFRALQVVKRYADGRVWSKKAPGHIVQYRAQRAPAYTNKMRRMKEKHNG